MLTAKVAGVDVSTAHFIDGKRVESKRKFSVESPIDGTHLAEMSAAGSSEVDAAVAAARRAFPAWAALGPEGRLPILKRLAKAILAHQNELAAVETADNGSLVTANVARMVPRAAQNIEFFADYALRLGHEMIDSPEVVNHVQFDPAGVAALITPWNAPLMLTTWKIGPVPRRRRHRCREAARMGAAHLLAARQPRGRGRPAAWRTERRAGDR